MTVYDFEGAAGLVDMTKAFTLEQHVVSRPHLTPATILCTFSFINIRAASRAKENRASIQLGELKPNT
jgi:hypothetical protein